ncbi:ABC transporter ATP-binding protein [Candidatus Saccharibacteria bacterium]|nr:ABC transporter ATP-binding protein [Candidatus Saccharibacteria bacterium]
MSIIKIENLTKTYHDKTILDNISLEIVPGELVWLKGASGTGKTTLLHIIAGLESPTSGHVIIETKKAANKVGFIYQDFYLQKQLTIRDNISLPGVFAGMPKKSRLARTKELAAALNISDILDYKPAQISGGQAERACIARALFLNPAILIADEPTNNLDEQNSKNVLNIIQEIWRDFDITIIIASHDPLVKDYATKTIELSKGKLHENT